MRKYLFLVMLLFCMSAWEVLSQCPNSPIPNRSYIKVVPADAAGGYHYKIRTFSNISSWTDLNGTNYTETDFFPIGWYATSSTSTFTVMHSAGATVAQMYMAEVLSKYDSFLSTSNTTVYQDYAEALEYWLADLDNAGLKAIIDIEPFVRVLDNVSGADVSFTTANAQALACKLKADHRVFAYYVADEFELPRKRLDGTTASLSNSAMGQVTDIFRTYDGCHPAIIVPVNPNSYFNGPYDHDIYDIFAPDAYVFGPNWEYGQNTLANPALLAAKARGAQKASSTPAYAADRIPPLLPWAPMVVLQAQDIAVGSNDISHHDMMYQSITPLVFGSQGLLYWWHGTSNPESKWTSSTLEKDVNSMISFITSKDNVKAASLADVLMKGTDRTNLVELSNISIDGRSSIPIQGTPISFSNKVSLATHYTYHNFTTHEADGKIYTVDKTSSIINWQSTTANNSLPNNARTNITALHAWDDKIYTCIQACGQIESVSNGGSVWSSSELPDCKSGDGVCFATRPDGVLFVIKDYKLYKRVSGTWQLVGPIQANVVIDGSPKAVTPPLITSMLWTNNNTVLISSVGDHTRHGIYRSTDAGLSWTFITSSAFIRSEQEDSKEEVWSMGSNGAVVLAGCDGRIVSGIVNGAFWSKLTSTNLPNTAIWTIEYVGGTWFVGTGNGIYYTTTLTSPITWTRVSGIDPEVNVWDLAADATHLYAATDKGVYKVSLSAPGSATSYMGTTPSCDLYKDYNTQTLDIACRSITINGDNIYVGTKRYDNSYARKDSGTIKDMLGYPPTQDDSELFGYNVKKYKGSYYIFAVNAFAPDLQMDFDLKAVLAPNETAYRISELDYTRDGSGVTKVTEKQLNLLDATMGTTASFTAYFGGYDAKVYRIDVLKWSEVDSIGRECIAPEALPYRCHTHGGGITLGDFDGEGKKNDLLVMWIPETPIGSEPFRYKILWDIVVDGNYIVSHDAVQATSMANFGSNCYGSFSGVAGDVHSGDVKAYNIGDSPRPEIFFMGIDAATSTYRVKVGWNLTGNNMASVFLTDKSTDNFPTTLRKDFTVPAPTNATGSGITMFQSQRPGQNSTYPDILMMHLTDEPAENKFKVIAADDWHTVPGSLTDPFAALATAPVTAQTTPYSIGWLTKGAGMDMGNLYPGYINGATDKHRELVCGGVEYQNGDNFRFIIYNFDPMLPVAEGTWRPSTSVPIKPTFYSGDVKDAGLALGDIDGDGDDDLIIMAISQECHGETPSPIFIRYGINTLINDPAKYGKFASHEDDIPMPFAPVNPGNKASSSLSNQPNPFDAGTVVTYSLDQSGHIELEVYSMLGDVVLYHDAGTQQPGNYSLPFSSDRLPNGIYICRLKVNGTVVNSTKMVLAR